MLIIYIRRSCCTHSLDPSHFPSVTYYYIINPIAYILLKDTETSDHPICTRPEVLIIDASLLRIHLNEWIAHDILHEWASIYLS